MQFFNSCKDLAVDRCVKYRGLPYDVSCAHLAVALLSTFYDTNTIHIVSGKAFEISGP